MDVENELVVYVATKVLDKILGSAATYLGDNLKNRTPKGLKNLYRIFRKAEFKLGNTINSPGSVPPRILKEVLDEGPFCDDELAAEYLGGILASSRSPEGLDDRGISFLKLTSQLSSYQIRVHYMCYTFWHQRFQRNWLRNMFRDDLDIMTIALTFDFLFRNMSVARPISLEFMWEHAVRGLARAGLLENLVEGLEQDRNILAESKGWILPEDTRFILKPTTFGGEFYIWGTGNGMLDPGGFGDLPKDLPGTDVISLHGQPTVLKPAIK